MDVCRNIAEILPVASRAQTEALEIDNHRRQDSQHNRYIRRGLLYYNDVYTHVKSLLEGRSPDRKALSLLLLQQRRWHSDSA